MLSVSTLKTIRINWKHLVIALLFSVVLVDDICFLYDSEGTCNMGLCQMQNGPICRSDYQIYFIDGCKSMNTNILEHRLDTQVTP